MDPGLPFPDTTVRSALPGDDFLDHVRVLGHPPELGSLVTAEIGAVDRERRLCVLVRGQVRGFTRE
jgi:hypothetical protein